MSKLEKIILILSILGIFLSLYATYHHYSTFENGVCDINDKLSCDVVNRSVYSEIAGVPVAIIGLAGYILINITSIMIYRTKNKDLKKTLFLLSLFGLIFSLYLTYIEAFKLYTFCPICLLSLAIITFIFILSSISLKKK